MLPPSVVVCRRPSPSVAGCGPGGGLSRAACRYCEDEELSPVEMSFMFGISEPTAPVFSRIP